MILGDSFIKAQKTFRCNSSDKMRVNPASLNVCIGDTFLIPRRKLGGIKLGDRVKYTRVKLEKGKSFKLRPGQFALATTQEWIMLDEDCAAFVHGRSSIGRAGLTVQNAGFIDPGFYGHITLELKNETRNTITIAPGYPVAQIIFVQALGVEQPYKGKYNGQIEATGSRMYLDRL